MSLVIDTSIIIAVITNEDSKRRIVELTSNEDLVAPASLHWEIGNAFSAMLKKKKGDLDLLLDAVAYYKQIPIQLVEVDLAKSLKVAAEFNIYAYDAYFLECAMSFKLPLLTLDNALKRIASQLRIEIKKL